MSKVSLPIVLVALLALALLCAVVIPTAAQPPVTGDGAGLIERVERLERRMDVGFAVGTVIFCAVDVAPGPDWVPCDGKSNFPDDAPQHLRGKLVPNLQGALVAVGKPYDPDQDSEHRGKHKRVEGTLAAQTVAGTSFALPKPQTKRIAADKGNATNPYFKGGLVAWFTANADYLNVKYGTAHWSCFGGSMNVAPAEYEYHPAGTKLSGNVDVAPPAHAFLQAYVRIR